MKNRKSLIILLTSLLLVIPCRGQETIPQDQAAAQESVPQDQTAAQESVPQDQTAAQEPAPQENVIPREGTASQDADGTVQESTTEQTTGETAGNDGKTPSEPEENFVLITDFPALIQTPELPTGCEITALTMMLNYYGFPAGKTMMAETYLPKQEFRIFTGATGKNTDRT